MLQCGVAGCINLRLQMMSVVNVDVTYVESCVFVCFKKVKKVRRTLTI